MQYVDLSKSLKSLHEVEIHADSAPCNRFDKLSNESIMTSVLREHQNMNGALFSRSRDLYSKTDSSRD